jgi:hypothetical protein
MKGGHVTNDLDSLLDSALQEMKISEQPQHVNGTPGGDTELKNMIEEFKQASTTPESTELPDRIDAALGKLLRLVFIGLYTYKTRLTTKIGQG